MTNSKKLKTSANMRKVKKLLENIPEDKRPIGQELFNELLFMQNTLTDLKEQVNNEGAVDLFEQGKQKFLREHPALKAYMTLLQRYSLIYKQFMDLFPNDSENQAVDELIDFIKQGD